MAVSGKLGRLYVSDGSSPTSQAYVLVGGARVDSFEKTLGTVDTTSKDSAYWRTFAATFREMDITVEGVFSDTAGEELMRAAFDATTPTDVDMKFDITGFGAYTFRGLIAGHSMSGNFDGVIEYRFSVKVATAPTFVGS